MTLAQFILAALAGTGLATVAFWVVRVLRSLWERVFGDKEEIAEENTAEELEELEYCQACDQAMLEEMRGRDSL